MKSEGHRCGGIRGKMEDGRREGAVYRQSVLEGNMGWKRICVQYRFGRIGLHMVCLWQDRKWRWHLAGIRRELFFASPAREKESWEDEISENNPGKN